MSTPTYLALDFETTGLDPTIHVPLEVYAVVLDEHFDQFFEVVHYRIDQPLPMLQLMEAKVLEMHLGTGLVRYDEDPQNLYVVEGYPQAHAENKLLDLIWDCPSLILLGSNPSFDRAFLPAVVRDRLHYRQLDVRSVIMALGPTVPWADGAPGDKHTARGDVMWAIRVAKQAREIGFRFGAAQKLEADAIMCSTLIDDVDDGYGWGSS